MSNTYYDYVNDYFIVYCPSYSSSPLLSKRVGRHPLEVNQDQSFSYTYKIPASRLKTNSGLVIKVGIQFNGEYLAFLEKTVKVISSKNINPLNYRSSPYVIKNRSFYLNETEVEESILFDEYRDYVECDEYNRLLFNNLSFQYLYPDSLTYENARIKFIDTHNLFSLISEDGDGYRSIPINLVEKESRVNIEIPLIFYNPLTLIPNDRRVGTKSKYLYVQKGKSKELSDYEFIIEVTGLGINKTSFSHYLETSISPFYLGDCESGDYCVVGGVRS